MNDLRTISIPKITDGEKFEYLCRDIYRNDTTYELVELNGRRGQTQQGVDVYAREKVSGDWIGIQCKCRAKGKQLTKVDIETEVSKAKGFNPAITTLSIYTTCDRDVKVQEIVRDINTSSNLNFIIEVRFWDDIEEALKDKQNYDVYYRYYSKYFADNLTLGHAVSKLFNLDLCFDDKIDTHYELMLGKIPNYKNQLHTNVNYYRGTYFFVNLTQSRFETFTVPCHDMDLIEAFPNQIDRHRVCNWLREQKSIEEFISSESNNHKYSLSSEQRLEFMLEE